MRTETINIKKITSDVDKCCGDDETVCLRVMTGKETFELNVNIEI